MAEEGEEKVESTGTTGAGGPTAGAGGGAGTGTDTATAAPEPVQYGKTLTRSRSERMVAGVAGGLGRYFGLDPILFRLGFAFLSLLGGAGIALYAAAWLLIPQEGEARSVGEVAAEKASAYVGTEDRSWIWITAIVIGGLVLIANLDRMHYSGAWFWGLLLIAGGIWLYRQDAGQAAGPPVPPPGAPHPVAAGAAAPTRPLDTPPAPRAVARPAAPKPPASALPRYTFAITLVALGVAAMFENAGTLDVTGTEYAAVALTAVGAGLLVGSVIGRARSLIFWGLVLSLFVLVGEQAGIPLRGGIGERSFQPLSPGELSGSYELFAGKMVFDLSDMEWGDVPAELDAEIVFGQIEILVPEGVDVQFSGKAEAGSLELFGQGRRGQDISLDVSEQSGAGPELTIDARVFMGEVAVSRTGMPARELS